MTAELLESRVLPKPSDDAALVPDTPRQHSPTSQHDGTQHPLKTDQVPSAKAATASSRRKMEVSQQSPTQVNEDRDYGEPFCDPLPSSPADTHNRTFQPDDTGAVNFGILSEFGRPSSQVSEDAGFENTRGEWRIPDITSQQQPSHAITPYKPYGAPETPALPKNPFGAKPGIAAPFAGTQLFGQTQFSSAMKKISPTSSRPSPHLFYNSVSPNIMETSPLKNRANVSSPTDIRTSSPQRLHDIPETVIRIGHGEPGQPEETPCNPKFTKEELIPESPTYRRPKSAGSREPLAHYEPMKKSQERKAHEDVPPLSLDSDDSDSDDAIRQMKKRKRIEKKRAQAAQEMERVSFTPSSVREIGDQPSRKKRRLLSDVEKKADAQPSGTSEPAKIQEPSSNIRSSLKATATPNDVAVSSEKLADKGAGTTEQVDGRKVPATQAERQQLEEDMIPATSPVRSLSLTEQRDIPAASEPELPNLAVGTPEVLQSEVTETSSLPPPRRRHTTYGRNVRQTRRGIVVTSSTSDAFAAEVDTKSPHDLLPGASGDDVLGSNSTELASPVLNHAHEAETGREKGEEPDSSPSLPQVDPSAPASTRPRRSARKPFTPLQPRVNNLADQTSSSLTVLSSTPVPSSKTTPATQESPASKRTKLIQLPSPGGRNLRKRSLRTRAKSDSPQPMGGLVRPAKRTPRLGSESTDELHRTPPGSALERSMAQPKASRALKSSFVPTHRGRLFTGMAFALSFQSNHEKQQERTKLESKISLAGGLILPEGFEELFERSTVMSTTTPIVDEDETLKLTKTGAESGFTALIADGHSRKAKYMQALALGLPCLAPQWITACLSKDAILDWEPYLLCAGSSAVLGNAIRSRNLPAYPADEAKLVDVIEERARLLECQSILVVVDSKKSRSEAKQPYIFLAQALGPSVSRVFTTQQARDTLRERERAGCPFDWLYVDKGTGTAESVLAPETGAKRNRKRTALAAHLTTNVRVLNDELVIQSLILGRMVDEEEMNF